MSGFLDAIREQLEYMLSLPERTVRSLAAVVGGTTALLTETLFPESLRGTTLYKVFWGDMQRFVINNVAKVQREGAGGDAASGDPNEVQRKMVGGALDTAALFAMHMSPLWVFAFVGDAAAGSNVFLERLVEHLKKNAVIAEDAQVSGLPDLLKAMQDASRQSAGAIDRPPLSTDELTRLAQDMTTSYRQMFAKAGDLFPRLETIWGRMQQLARRENISVERVTGILTVDVASWARKGIGAAFAVGQTGTELFGEKILDSYLRTLDAIQAEGSSAYLSNRMKPFLQAAADHFDPGHKTWTESILQRAIPRAAPSESVDASEPQSLPPPAESSPGSAGG